MTPFQSYNKELKRQVLEREALNSGKVKQVTAKHLALSQNCAKFLVDLLNDLSPIYIF